MDNILRDFFECLIQSYSKPKPIVGMDVKKCTHQDSVYLKRVGGVRIHTCLNCGGKVAIKGL